MIAEAWKLGIDAQDCQGVLVCAAADTPSVGLLPGTPSLNIDLLTLDVVSLEFNLILLYLIYDFYYTPESTWLKLDIGTF
jgi:hypothetical protein